MTQYITLYEAVLMHRELITRFGGADGIRDMGALESALSRPQSGYYDDTIHQAAALFESLAMNHPFVDGNKRIAFACVDVFLRINGYRLTRTSTEIYAWMLSLLESGQFKIDSIQPWLRTNTNKMA